ncbi:hypothetical protein DRE_02150 [Drechslerella stenobrocha 248]|uniref:Uncharacterized protein n=1 Tax=Drechslerella stenobrocha 248 TaxID=1043628 RepID=W7HW34_9PEZI|nr:hypothetical protein DRE_02150 [Drechslerella stenobrocha 248]
MSSKSTNLQPQVSEALCSDPPTLVRPPPTRLARHYVAVERADLDFSSYPSNTETFIPSIHDAQYCQGILRNFENFSPQTNCDIFQFVRGQGCLERDIDGRGVNTFLEEAIKRIPRIPSVGASPRALPSEPETHVIFCSLVKPSAIGPNFRLQSSLSLNTTKKLLEHYQISPQFVPFLLGEPNYGAPGSFSIHDVNGHLAKSGKYTPFSRTKVDPDPNTTTTFVEFFCQHPRWNVLEVQQPWSVYMSYDIPIKRTFYLVVTGVNCPKTTLVKDRLFQSFCQNQDHHIARRSFADPFFIHTLISHESLNDLKPVMTVLRTHLYDQLDEVDAYARKPSDRGSLEKLTTELHKISQDADSLLASADMAIMVTDRMLESHQLVRHLFTYAKYDEYNKIEAALSFLRHSAQSNKRWMESYKNRKDIAMNLVFNLVTQQDAYTNILIAREAKRDGSSMKIIAALTTFFLPATFVATLFGMAFFDFSDGAFTVAPNTWVYAAVTMPVMAVTVLVWWVWDRITVGSRMKGLLFARRESVTDDIEALKGRMVARVALDKAEKMR